MNELQSKDGFFSQFADAVLRAYDKGFQQGNRRRANLGEPLADAELIRRGLAPGSYEAIVQKYGLQAEINRRVAKGVKKGMETAKANWETEIMAEPIDPIIGEEEKSHE